MPPRYEVAVFGRIALDANYGSVDTSHTFTSQTKAETFARAISHYLPRPSTGELLAWVLVSAFAIVPNGGPRSICYLSYDPGGMEVKHHVIPFGYYGAPVISTTEDPHAR